MTISFSSANPFAPQFIFMDDTILVFSYSYPPTRVLWICCPSDTLYHFALFQENVLNYFWPKVLQKEYNGTCNAKHPFFGFCVSTLKGRAVIESVEKRKGNKQLAAFSPKIFSFPKIDGKKSKPTIAAWVIWESFFMLSAALPCAERCFAGAALTPRSMHLFPFICILLSFQTSRMLPSGSLNITTRSNAESLVQ